MTERAGQKINLQCLLADLCMQFLQIWRGRLFLSCRREHAGSVLKQLRLPLRDLIRMNVELLR